MATPQITMRVDKDRLAAWKTAALLSGTSVSEQVRLLMDQWAEQIESSSANKSA